MNPEHPAEPVRCPFSGSGSPADELRRCPGFAPQVFHFGSGPGAAIPDQVSCGYLGAEPTRRGFMAACHHPVQPRLLQVVDQLQSAFVTLPWVDRDAVPAALIATDTIGRITQWNAAAERLYGWPREEVWGHDIRAITVGPTDLDVANAIMVQLAAGRSWRGQFSARRRDGQVVVIEAVDIPLVARDVGVIGVLGISAPTGTLDGRAWDAILARVPGGRAA